MSAYPNHCESQVTLLDLLFSGCMNDDYKGMFTGHHRYDTSYSATGFSSTIISARVSYVFNLHGPCLTLDTACSSALVAVHLGAQAILAGTIYSFIISKSIFTVW